MYSIKGKYSTTHIMTDEVEIDSKVYEQLLNVVNCHIFTNDSIIMPDYHYGKGCTIGFTMEITDKVVPFLIGVDIGCNMLYVNFNKHLDLDKRSWLEIDATVRKHIPMAYGHHKSPQLDFENDFPWALSTQQMLIATSQLNKRLGTEYKAEPYTSKWFFDMCDKINIKPKVAVNSLGSLGGGNHFIEFGHSKNTGNTGVTLHSGSRGFGAKLATYWQKKAKEHMKKLYITDRNKEIMKIKCDAPREHWDTLIKATKKPSTPTSLEYLEGEDMYGYLHGMLFCQIYAHKNILDMASIILDLMDLPQSLMLSENTVHTVHNYLNFDDWIIRKGAVQSLTGQRMLIPFNMEDGILICEGKSNEEWYKSAPHGAGRLFGRGEMKRNKDIDVKKIRERMNKKGIFLSVVPKDEVKEAYKDPAFIEEAIKPTATIVDRLIPVLTLKAKD